MLPELALCVARYGMVLKQRANFYNNISTEMVPCQKPMLLKDAVEFEKVRAWRSGGHAACLLSQRAVLRCSQLRWGQRGVEPLRVARLCPLGPMWPFLFLLARSQMV